MTKRRVIFYEHYFLEFYNQQPDAVRRKINQVLVWIQTIDKLPVSIFKSIEQVAGLFEIRIIYAGNIYRIFCCLDNGNLVVLFNAFQKKTQKAPQSEINKAKQIMKEYMNSKKS